MNKNSGMRLLAIYLIVTGIIGIVASVFVFISGTLPQTPIAIALACTGVALPVLALIAGFVILLDKGSVVLKTDLSPDNGAVVDTKWKVGPLSYHACASEAGNEPTVHDAPMPEIIIYDHVGFKGAYARTNLSFHFLGDFWNDRLSSVIIVSGVWRFYRDDYYKGDYWDLGPGFYECFFKDKGPDDVVSSFQAIKLTP
ncbi:MAG TPA: beta/gamma crystallin-related protein [Chthoniobacterales bacterium]|jgi:hypothetical protein